MASASRIDGRETDQLRPVEIQRKLPEACGRIRADLHGRHDRTLFSERGRERTAFSERKRQGLGHGGIRNVAAKHEHAGIPRRPARQRLRPHAGDPAAHRGGRFAPYSTWTAWGNGPYSSIATSSKPTGEPVPRRSRAVTWHFAERGVLAFAAGPYRPRPRPGTRSPPSAWASSAACPCSICATTRTPRRTST